MKILLVTQIFETHNDTGSDRHYFFAKQLVSQGHEVSIITGNVDYKNASRRFEESDGVINKVIDGISVNYVPVYTRFRGSFYKRFYFFITFFYSSLTQALREHKVDIIYAVSTPLTVGFLGVVLGKLKRVPFVFEVTDVWPDAAIHAGVVKNKVIIFLAKIVEHISYKYSSKIICLTDGIRNSIIKKGVKSNKVILITNGVDLNLFKLIDAKSKSSLKKEYSIEGKFVSMYLGAHGIYNSLGTILEAAKLLRDRKEIVFIFVGDGDEKMNMLDFVSRNKLDNVKFFGTVSRIKSVEMLGMADCFLLPNKKGEFFEGNLPNKLFDFLATGAPVIVAGHGESADVVINAGSGVVINAEDSVAMSSSILEILNMEQSKRSFMGSLGRHFVSIKYNRYNQAKILINLLENLGKIKL
uniref:glycosyltransferase family 4 protein n=1 Tax=Limnohabitans sp. TaxID=1907725 RepID=UPI0040481F73